MSRARFWDVLAVRRRGGFAPQSGLWSRPPIARYFLPETDFRRLACLRHRHPAMVSRMEPCYFERMLERIDKGNVRVMPSRMEAARRPVRSLLIRSALQEAP